LQDARRDYTGKGVLTRCTATLAGIARGVGTLVVPSDPHEALDAERQRRVNALGDELHAAQAGIGTLAERQAEQRKEIEGLDDDVARLTRDLDSVRDQLRTNTMVLVGFAFTVAGSAIGLALALGGHG
jgi:uncharacterized coiled-coil protein SlyX